MGKETSDTKPSEPEHFEILERADESQIDQMARGIVIHDMAYQFESAGKIVTGLSIAGIKEAARMAVRSGYDLRCDPAQVEENEREFRAKVKVVFIAPSGKLLELWGYSKQPKHYANGRENEFAFVQTCSKAQRNAIRMILPEKLLIRMLELALQQGKVKKLDTTSASAPASKASQEHNLQLNQTIKWSVQDGEFPISFDERPYNLMKRVMQAMTDKHKIRFMEEVAANYVTAIRCSEIPKDKFDELAGALTWVLQKVSNCKRDDVKCWVENIK